MVEGETNVWRGFKFHASRSPKHIRFEFNTFICFGSTPRQGFQSPPRLLHFEAREDLCPMPKNTFVCHCFWVGGRSHISFVVYRTGPFSKLFFEQKTCNKTLKLQHFPHRNKQTNKQTNSAQTVLNSAIAFWVQNMDLSVTSYRLSSELEDTLLESDLNPTVEIPSHRLEGRNPWETEKLTGLFWWLSQRSEAYMQETA